MLFTIRGIPHVFSLNDSFLPDDSNQIIEVMTASNSDASSVLEQQIITNQMLGIVISFFIVFSLFLIFTFTYHLLRDNIFKYF